MTESTEHFGLTKLGPGEGIHSGGDRFASSDRDIIDQALYSASKHRHTGEFTDNSPLEAPDLTLSTGGTLPAGTTLRYVYTFLDPETGETVASPEATVTTSDALVAPDAPTSTLQSIGGSLEPGNYYYVATAYQGSSTVETKAENPLFVQIPAGTSTNQVELTLPTLDAGVDGYNVYRRGPSEARYLHIGTTTDTSFVDDGLTSSTRGLPSENSTSAANAVEIAIPGATPSVPAGNTWKVYRTDTVGDWSTSYLTTLDENTLTYTDVGDGTAFGQPPSAALSMGVAEQIDLTSEVTGELPVTNGGTGADNEADARVNLGLEIGVDVQAHSEILDATTEPFTVELKAELDNLTGGGGTGDLSVDARQNLRLWQLEASVLAATEGMEGWQGDSFLLGQDEIASNTGAAITRNADLDAGSAALDGTTPDSVVITTNAVALQQACDTVYFLAELVAPGTQIGGTYDYSEAAVGTILVDVHRAFQYTGLSFTFANEYVAVGPAGEILYSTDGATWTAASVPEVWDVNDVYHDLSLSVWVAACGGGILESSDGGATWTAAVTGGNYKHIAENQSANTLYIVGEAGAFLQRSTAGEYSAVTAPAVADFNAVARGSSSYTTVAGNGGTLWTRDGSTWTTRDSVELGVTGDFTDAIYCASYDSVSEDLWFKTIVVGVDGTAGFALSAGSTLADWGNLATFSSPARAVAFGPDLVVAVGDNGLVATTSDGVTWTELDLGVTTNFTGVAYTGSGWLLSGDDGSITTTTLTYTPAAVIVTYEASLNGGFSWTGVTNGGSVTVDPADIGDSLALRATLLRNDPSEDAHLYWFIGYASASESGLTEPAAVAALDGGSASTALFDDTIDGGSAADLTGSPNYDGGGAA